MASPRPLLDEEGQQSSGSPVQIGEVINGKYRIERQIGRGGMGIVLAATHLQLEHLVAIKVMRRDLVADDKSLDRLLMEARSAARIRSEHVARVLDVGQLENGSPFIVMEYLEGENLADLLDREGALSVEQAASFLMQCCLALAEVHVAEMVHRDLKPGNLFIAQLPEGSPTVKIVDFGISKHIGSARDHAATTSPQVLGSPFYMSPEQMRAERVDERSDIWGLGAILFEMLTGRPPFIGDTLPEVYSAVLNDHPPAVDSLRPGVPAGLDDVVQRCLEKDPAQRFCDVADLAEALAPFAGPSAAQSVERVTRILTNPDAVRARYSLPPGASAVSGASASSSASISGAAAGSALSEGAISGGPDGLGSGMLAAGEGSESMAGDAEGGGAPKRPGRVDAELVPPRAGHAPVGATWLEPSAAGSEGPERASWRPSRSPHSGEFTPLSATGVQSGRGRRATRARVAAIAGALVLLAGAGWLFLRGAASPEPPAAPVVEVVEVVKLAPPGEPGAEPPPEPPAAPEPRVTPIPPEAAASEPKAVATPSPPRAPAPRATPEAAPSGGTVVPPRRPPAEASAPVVPPSRPAAPEPERAAPVPPRSSAASAAARPASSDDPWNPESFGDRR